MGTERSKRDVGAASSCGGLWGDETQQLWRPGDVWGNGRERTYSGVQEVEQKGTRRLSDEDMFGEKREGKHPSVIFLF